jgi:hypothetical protein
LINKSCCEIDDNLRRIKFTIFSSGKSIFK